ncbi:hypothetical protein [Saccharopolyspora rosea]|uniref:Uncharacterized protein n=1 Tax=Saccharopolyspora rosea TaxID=524884 RepID=A0ABW3FYS9_9PSEU
MDAATTVRIPREVVQEADGESTDTMRAIAPPPQQTAPQQSAPQQRPQPQRQPEQGHGWPTEDYGQLPPNPYQTQRGPNEFGPLGSQAANQQYPQY